MEKFETANFLCTFAKDGILMPLTKPHKNLTNYLYSSF